jgi:predicted nucleic acid-binding protein
MRWRIFGALLFAPSFLQSWSRDYAGVRDGTERGNLDLFISRSIVAWVDRKVAERGGLIKRQFFKSHGAGLADALIAATAEAHAEAHGATLVTLNSEHFPTLKDVLLPCHK